MCKNVLPIEFQPLPIKLAVNISFVVHVFFCVHGNMLQALRPFSTSNVSVVTYHSIFFCVNIISSTHGTKKYATFRYDTGEVENQLWASPLGYMISCEF